MSEYVLEMKDVYKAFPGVVALNHVQLQLKPGKVHALIGENCAGKSTLMKCMFGIYKMDEGEIFIDGEKVEIHNPSEALSKGIAMVHQELQPIPARPIGETSIWAVILSRSSWASSRPSTMTRCMKMPPESLRK